MRKYCEISPAPTTGALLYTFMIGDAHVRSADGPRLKCHTLFPGRVLAAYSRPVPLLIRVLCINAPLLASERWRRTCRVCDTKIWGPVISSTAHQ